MLHRRLFSAANFMNDIAVKKLKYLATKRGIVENELIFEKFVNSHFDKLNGSDLALFDEFLNEYDWDIYAWITEQRKAPEKYLNSNLLKLLKDSTLKK